MTMFHTAVWASSRLSTSVGIPALLRGSRKPIPRMTVQLLLALDFHRAPLLGGAWWYLSSWCLRWLRKLHAQRHGHQKCCFCSTVSLTCVRPKREGAIRLSALWVGSLFTSMHDQLSLMGHRMTKRKCRLMWIEPFGVYLRWRWNLIWDFWLMAEWLCLVPKVVVDVIYKVAGDMSRSASALSPCLLALFFGEFEVAAAMLWLDRGMHPCKVKTKINVWQSDAGDNETSQRPIIL